MKKEILTFKIDGLTPEALPMMRLAAYMAELAHLFSNAERVHFDKVKKGNAVLQAWIEPQAAPKVHWRLQVADSPDAPPDTAAARMRRYCLPSSRSSARTISSTIFLCGSSSSSSFFITQAGSTA